MPTSLFSRYQRNKSLQYLGETNTKIMGIRFDDEDKYIAAGTLKLYIIIREKPVKTPKSKYITSQTGSWITFWKARTKNRNSRSHVSDGDQKPKISKLRTFLWRQMQTERFNTGISTLVDSVYFMKHHLGKCLSTIREDIQDCHISCLDYQPDGSKFVIVGTDPIVTPLIPLLLFNR